MYEFAFRNQIALAILASGAWGLSAFLAARLTLSRRAYSELSKVGKASAVFQRFSEILSSSFDRTELLQSSVLRKIARDHDIADFSITFSQWAVATLLVGLLSWLASTFILSPIVGVIFAILTLYGSNSIIRHQAQQRRELMNAQLPLAFEHIAYSIGAGQHLLQAVDKAIESLDIPVSRELKTMREYMAYGATFAEAMVALDEKWNLDELHKITIALTLNARYGGNIKALLLRASSNMKQSELLRKNLKAQTAQGRLSMRIVLIAPIALVTILSLVMPGFWQTLVQTKSGQYMLLSAMMLDFLGYQWIKSVVRVGW